MIRIAIVGFGKIARDQHVPAIHRNPNFAFVAAVDPIATEAPVPLFRSIAELAASGVGVDAVALCTPPDNRGQGAAQAFDAGWHVLLEKPPETTLTGAKSILRCAARSGRSLLTAWHSRENEAVDQARELLRGEKLRSLRVRWREDANKWHPGQRWIWQPGGFGVFDPGINALSIVTGILPEPVWPIEALFHVEHGAETPVRADFRLRSAQASDLGDAVLDFRSTEAEQWEIAVETDRRRIELQNGGTILKLDGDLLVEGSDDEYPRLYRRFADLIGSGASDVDLGPLELTSDIFLLAQRRF